MGFTRISCFQSVHTISVPAGERPEYTGKRTARSYTRDDSAPQGAGKIRSRDPAGPEPSPTPAHRREERIQSREGVEVHPAK
ncbi:hypothetical protein MC885_015208 [Smutsia gigantea]|nr:hypothetical protein MC885_015208 [Smutsia gigantea]